MAIEYFGECNSDGSIIASPTGEDDNSSSNEFVWLAGAAILACPGSGTYNVKSLAAYARILAGSPVIRIGIYTTAGAKICETNTITVVGSSLAWQECLAASMSGTLTLTGGTNYYLSLAFKAGGTVGINYKTGSNGDLLYKMDTDYTAGLPTTLPSSPLSWTGRHYIRCGVEAAASVYIPTRRNSTYLRR